MSLILALKEINLLVPKEQIIDIILYGSCAKGTFKYNSDVDIMVLIDKEWFFKNIEIVRKLLAFSIPYFENLPDVDIRVECGTIEEQNDTWYWKLIKKEGKSVWKK